MQNFNKIRLFSIDVDGCLVQYKNIGSEFQSSWDALGFAYGLKSIWDQRTKRFYKRFSDDIEWAKADIADLAGKKISECEKSLFPLPYALGVREFAEFSKHRYYRGLLTTSIDLVARKAQIELGFDFCYCNVLHRNNGYFAGTLDYFVPTWRKHDKIKEICQEFHVEPEEICHVGDNENDIAVGENVGIFIALDAKKEEVKTKADFIVDNFLDLIEVINAN